MTLGERCRNKTTESSRVRLEKGIPIKYPSTQFCSNSFTTINNYPPKKYSSTLEFTALVMICVLNFRKTCFRTAESTVTWPAGSDSHGILYARGVEPSCQTSRSPVAPFPPYHSAALHTGPENFKSQSRAALFSQLQSTKEQCPKLTQRKNHLIFDFLSLYTTPRQETHMERSTLVNRRQKKKTHHQSNQLKGGTSG